MVEHSEYVEPVTALDVIRRIVPAWRPVTSGCSKCHGDEG